MYTRQEYNEEKQEQTMSEIAKKAKVIAWITAIIVPTLYIVAYISQINGMGAFVMVIINILFSPVAVILLRFVTAPIYQVILNKNSKPIMRKAMICTVIILVAAFSYLLCETAVFPMASVRSAVKEIPEMQTYFTEHKNELEIQRLQSDNIEQFGVLYHSSNNVLMWFCYNETGSESTGYKERNCYTYMLDEHWYIYINFQVLG